MIDSLLEADGLAHAGYDEDGWFRFVEHVVETLDVGPGTRVWDAGCGAGSFLFPLSLNGYLVGGVDLDAERVALARSAMPSGNFAVESPLGFDPAEPAEVVVSSRGPAACRDQDDVRALVARMTAKATHAIALMGVNEGTAPYLQRAVLLRVLAEAGAAALQFEESPSGLLLVFARVTAGGR